MLGKQKRIRGKQIQAGEWYLTSACKSCGGAIPMMQVTKNFRLSGDGSFSFENVPCQDCGAIHDYPLSEMKVIQVQKAGES